MHVACILLTADRQRQTERAIRSFLEQDWKDRGLVIVDSGKVPFVLPEINGVYYAFLRFDPDPGLTIGFLRNRAAGNTSSDLIAHWDSDDWSAPNRLTEQIRLLEDRGVDLVGCNEMVCWDSRTRSAYVYRSQDENYCMGTSMLYRRSLWERSHFPETSAGEDTVWSRGLGPLKAATSALAGPLMIAEVHAGNTAMRVIHGAKEWRRAPDWDERAARIMAL